MFTTWLSHLRDNEQTFINHLVGGWRSKLTYFLNFGTPKNIYIVGALIYKLGTVEIKVKISISVMV